MVSVPVGVIGRVPSGVDGPATPAIEASVRDVSWCVAGPEFGDWAWITATVGPGPAWVTAMLVRPVTASVRAVAIPRSLPCGKVRAVMDDSPLGHQGVRRDHVTISNDTTPTWSG